MPTSALSVRLQAALRLLYHWKAVRPGSALLGVPTTELEEQQLVERIITVVGEALVLRPRGRVCIGLSPWGVSDTVAANALYQQDSLPRLQAEGFDKLRPGQGIYRVVTDKAGVSHPLIGQLTFRGYSRKRILQVLKATEMDLTLQRARLIVLYPDVAPQVVHDRLRLIAAVPLWQTSYPRGSGPAS